MVVKDGFPVTRTSGSNPNPNHQSKPPIRGDLIVAIWETKLENQTGKPKQTYLFGWSKRKRTQQNGKPNWKTKKQTCHFGWSKTSKKQKNPPRALGRNCLQNFCDRMVSTMDSFHSHPKPLSFPSKACTQLAGQAQQGPSIVLFVLVSILHNFKSSSKLAVSCSPWIGSKKSGNVSSAHMGVTFLRVPLKGVFLGGAPKKGTPTWTSRYVSRNSTSKPSGPKSICLKDH